MPRVRGFRDPRTINFYNEKPRQLDRLLLANNLRLTTSRLSEPQLVNVLKHSYNAQLRHVNLKGFKGQDLITSPLYGTIVAVKDNFVTQDLPATCASNILEGFSAQDATSVDILRRNGLSIVAKTNMDEFGMGSHSTYSAYGAVRNSVSKEALSVGGSSGGSALAIASGLVDSALGSDTGGSVRLPAAYNSIAGFKPSYGIISRHGLIPYANSLDTVGLLGKNCLDIWFLYSILNKADHQDPTSLTRRTRQRIHQARLARVGKHGLFSFVTYPPSRGNEREGRDLPFRTMSQLAKTATTPRRIGVPVEYNIEEMHSSVRSAWVRTLSNLQYLGHEIIPISLPSTQQALSAYYVLAPAEASSNLAKYDGVRYGRLRGNDAVDDANGTLYSEYRGQFFGEEVKRRILLGSFTLSAGSMDNYFIQAQKVRRMVQTDFNLVFRMANPLLPRSRPNSEGVDYILCPTTPTPPPKLSEVTDADPLTSYMNDVFTVPASLAGLPAISVPAHQDPKHIFGEERAIGMQVIGQFGDDLGVIHFARRWLDRDMSYDKPRSTVARRQKLV